MVRKNKLQEKKTKEEISFAIAIPCFNEEQNIGELLESLCSNWDSEYRPEKIAVFSSECRDGTEEIVRNLAAKSPIPIILRTERKRKGKCHAVNHLIEIIGKVDVIILVSGDVQISATNLIKMLKDFKQKNIGVVAGRVIPVCDEMNIAYRVSKVMWDLHHLMVLQAPKSTEVTAFRNLGFCLDEKSLVDEAEIEWNISKRGLVIKYCDSATIKNKAAQTLIDHVKQRTRVTAGHCGLKKRKQYTVGSMKASVRIKALVKYFRSRKTDYFAFFILLVIEAYILLAGYFLTFINENSDGKWARIESAKKKFK